MRATIESLAASNENLVESNKALMKSLKVQSELHKEQTELRQKESATHKDFVDEVSKERDHYTKKIKDLTFYMEFFEKQAAAGAKFELGFD